MIVIFSQHPGARAPLSTDFKRFSNFENLHKAQPCHGTLDDVWKPEHEQLTGIKNSSVEDPQQRLNEAFGELYGKAERELCEKFDKIDDEGNCEQAYLGRGSSTTTSASCSGRWRCKRAACHGHVHKVWRAPVRPERLGGTRAAAHAF